MTRLPAYGLARLIWLPLMVIGATSAFAADQDANSRITAVTVFPRAAEVSRTAELAIPAGEHTVVLGDLPARLLADSIRVDGDATGTLEIGSVDTKAVLLPEEASASAERKRIEKEIERLGDEHTALSDRVASAEAQKVLIRNLAKLPEQPGPRDQAQGARSPSDWAAVSSLIGRQMADAQKEIRDANIAMRKVQREITDLQRKLATVAPRRIQRTQVRVNVTAEAALDAKLTVRYQVADASWTPVYDARLATGDDDTKPALELVRRARISQRTGEEWTDIRLTLSTTDPRRGTAAPNVFTLRADFRPSLSKSKYSRSSEAILESMDAAPAPQPEADKAEGFGGTLQTARPIARKRARVVTAPFQANYVIAGRHTIPTDGAVRGVEIDQVDFAPKLAIRTVPRKRAAAFLYADFKVVDGNHLLPGAVSLFRDGTFVGRGRLPTLSSGEDHELGFGEDDTVRVEHITLTQKTGESGIISTTRTDTRQFRMTVINGHKRAVDIRVFDQLPIAGDDDIEVVMTSGTTAPTVRDVEDKKGVFAWDFSLKPQAKKVINFGYRLAWPDGRSIWLREVRKQRKKRR